MCGNTLILTFTVVSFLIEIHFQIKVERNKQGKIHLFVGVTKHKLILKASSLVDEGLLFFALSTI